MGDQTPLVLEAIQSQIKQLTEIRSNCHNDANLAASDEDGLLRECVLQLEGKLSQIIEEFSDVSSLQPEDLDTYLENLKGGLSSVEAENAKLFNEVGSLTKGYLEDSIRLQMNIEGLNSSLESIESQGIDTKRAEYQPESEGANDDCKFKISELSSQLEKKNGMLTSLENLHYIKKRHQFYLLPMCEKILLDWFVRKVQDKIVLSTLRKSLVKAASKSRHSIEYVDKDEIIVAHLLDGVDAYIKVSEGWPISNSPLKLLSLKGSSQSSKEVTFSFLCKVEERVNSLDEQVCQNLSTFMDATEEVFKQIMHIEIQSNRSIDK